MRRPCVSKGSGGTSDFPACCPWASRMGRLLLISLRQPAVPGATWKVSEVNETQHLRVLLDSKSSSHDGKAKSGAELGSLGHVLIPTV